MSQSATLRALDAAIMSGLDGIGFTDAVTYTQVGGGVIACTAYIDRGVALQGFDGQVRTDAVTVTLFRSEIGEALPKRGAIIAVVGGDSFKVDQITNADESRVVCLVM